MATNALTWVTWDGARDLVPGMFAARVVGASMQPLVPSGSVCLFRPYAHVATSMRPVLVRHASLGDVEAGGQFTVKDLVVLDDRTPRIELRSRNPAFAPIVLDSAEAAAGLHVVAELVMVLGSM